MIIAANLAVEEYVLLHDNCVDFWSFDDSLFFAGTLASTIGYGNIAPRSFTGRVFCLIYVVFVWVSTCVALNFFGDTCFGAKIYLEKVFCEIF